MLGDSVQETLMVELDHFDLALLDVLQRFGRATHQQLGEQVPLSPSQIGGACSGSSRRV